MLQGMHLLHIIFSILSFGTKVTFAKIWQRCEIITYIKWAYFIFLCSILVCSLDWSTIGPNLPWLV